MAGSPGVHFIFKPHVLLPTSFAIASVVPQEWGNMLLQLRDGRKARAGSYSVECVYTDDVQILVHAVNRTPMHLVILLTQYNIQLSIQYIM